MASTGLRLCRSWKRSRDGDHYDFRSALRDRPDHFVCPAALEPEVSLRAQALALDAYRVLGCYGFARIDLMLSNDEGELTVLEADAIPGFTETSLLPQAAEAAGISFAAIVQRVLDLALARARS